MAHKEFPPGPEKEGGRPARRFDHSQNMGRVQRDPLWEAPAGTPGKWSDGGEQYDSRRRPEDFDREEREAHGKPLVACYRHILGPTPQLLPGDHAGARAYLLRIEQAIEQGGWTSSESRRLRRMRDKWRARATGEDGRFAEVGNKRGGLDRYETENVRQRRIVEGMRQLLNSRRNEGD